MKKCGVLLALFAVLTLVALIPVSAWQEPTVTVAAGESFDAASIRINESGAIGGGARLQPGGLYTATNMPVIGLIASAFGADRPLMNSQIVGAPDWITAVKVDMTARANSSGPPATMREVNVMLRQLLMDRLKLQARRDTQEQPIYALVKARADGRLGPNLHLSSVDCLALAAQRAANPSTAPASTPCRGIRFGVGSWSACCPDLSALTTMLSGNTQRLVVDRTGLTGHFDAELTWAAPSPGDGPVPDAPSLFTAVQEQLGLKLESTKGPVDVLVIDHIERPTED
jgi:uncharacterized protein (TIGR03435 family)